MIKNQLYPNFQLNYKYYHERALQEETELSRFSQFISRKNDIDQAYRQQLDTLAEQMGNYQKGLTKDSPVTNKLQQLITIWEIQQQQLGAFNTQVQDTILSHNEAFLQQQKMERKQFESAPELDAILRENIERVQASQAEYIQAIAKGNPLQKEQIVKKLEYEYDQYNFQLDNLFTQYNRQEELLYGQQQQRRQQMNDTVMRYIVFMIGYLKNQQYDVDRIIGKFQSSSSSEPGRRYIDQDIQAKYIITKIYLQSFLQKVDQHPPNQAPSIIDTFTRKFSAQAKHSGLIQMERHQTKSMRTTDQLRSMDGDHSIDSVDSPLETALPQENNKILVSRPSNQPDTDRLTLEMTRTMQEMRHTERQLNRKQKEIEKEIKYLVQALFDNRLQPEQLGILLQFVDFDTLDFFLEEIEGQRYQQYLEDQPFHQLGSLFQTLTLYIQKNNTFIKHKAAFSNQAVQAVIRICNMSKQSFRKNNQSIYQLYVAQVLDYDLTIYKNYFLQNFQRIFQQTGDHDQLVADQVSFLIYIGLNYHQLETCLSSLKEQDNTRYKRIMNSANVQFLNTHDAIGEGVEQGKGRTSVLRQYQQREKWRN